MGLASLNGLGGLEDREELELAWTWRNLEAWAGWEMGQWGSLSGEEEEEEEAGSLSEKEAEEEMRWQRLAAGKLGELQTFALEQGTRADSGSGIIHSISVARGKKATRQNPLPCCLPPSPPLPLPITLLTTQTEKQAFCSSLWWTVVSDPDLDGDDITGHAYLPVSCLPTFSPSVFPGLSALTTSPAYWWLGQKEGCLLCASLPPLLKRNMAAARACGQQLWQP